MPQEEQSGTRLKIFLAAFLVIICAFFALYSYNFITMNKNYISQQSQVSNACINLNFDVISASYDAGSLLVTVKNQEISTSNIKKIFVNVGGRTLSKETSIPPSSQEQVAFDGLSEKYESISVYPNDCDAYAKIIYPRTS